ncbi:MAG TPA: transposase [Gammaproteobacteria bacterium]|nr:transposase [Gammaproteobacteria bacterium]HIL98898.1 transposase [Pseudomonadales bacterium]
MFEIIELLTHCFVTLIKFLKPGGVKLVMAESIAMKHQLIVMNRGKKRSPALITRDRFLFGILTLFIGERRLQKVAVIVKPATILAFHKALVKRKYSRLYSNKVKKIPGRKARDQVLIDLVVEMKRRNPSFGYGRISMQILEAFGITISRFAVGRILRNTKHTLPSGVGPSWLTFIGHVKDSLWAVDLFRCESATLKSHWVMVVIDQFTRRIIGFAVHAGDCDGVAYCRMFNKIISGKSLPKYLSSDNDPLFLFHRWKANLRIVEIHELKSVPGTPTSHPFIERVIGTTRREYLDHVIFFNSCDLQKKLDRFQKYYNDNRTHSSLNMKTPKRMAEENSTDNNVASLDQYRWESSCNGLYQLPVAA